MEEDKGFDYGGQIALVTLIVSHPTHVLLMGPSSMRHLLATYSQASIKAHHSSYRISDSCTEDHCRKQETELTTTFVASLFFYLVYEQGEHGSEKSAALKHFS